MKATATVEVYGYEEDSTTKAKLGEAILEESGDDAVRIRVGDQLLIFDTEELKTALFLISMSQGHKRRSARG